jgi:hypothetical protein
MPVTSEIKIEATGERSLIQKALACIRINKNPEFNRFTLHLMNKELAADFTQKKLDKVYRNIIICWVLIALFDIYLIV